MSGAHFVKLTGFHTGKSRYVNLAKVEFIDADTIGGKPCSVLFFSDDSSFKVVEQADEIASMQPAHEDED